jgi:hypothetical protein
MSDFEFSVTPLFTDPSVVNRIRGVEQFDPENFPNHYIIYELRGSICNSYIYNNLSKRAVYNSFPISGTITVYKPFISNKLLYDFDKNASKMSIPFYYNKRFFMGSKVIETKDGNNYTETVLANSFGGSFLYKIKDMLYINDTGLIINIESGEINSKLYDRYNSQKYRLIDPYCIKECIIPMLNDYTIILYNFITNNELLNIDVDQRIITDEKGTLVPIKINTVEVNNDIIRIGDKWSHGSGRAGPQHCTHIFIIKSDADVPLEEQCVICYKRTTKSHLLVPCGHTQYCEKCINKIDKCSLCRVDIAQVIKIQK